VGKSVRIDEAKAIAWLEETGGQPPKQAPNREVG
jgi:hypothetical protein